MTATHPGGTAPLADHTVSRIGYGAMQLSGPGGRPRPSDAEARRVLIRAIGLGVNHVDTASFYGDGLANRLIRDALSPFPDDLVIVSKVGAVERDGKLRAAQRPAELRAGVEADLRTLAVDRIDVVNLRRLDRGPGIVAEGAQRVDLDAQLAEMVALRDEGKIGAIGLSSVTAAQLRGALGAGIACVQNAYNLLDRTHQVLFDLCRTHGIAWVPFFPLGSAFAGGQAVTEDPTLGRTAGQLGATPAQVGLAWLLAQAENVLLIPGTTTVAHLEDNLAAGEVRLDAEQLARLDGIAG